MSPRVVYKHKHSFDRRFNATRWWKDGDHKYVLHGRGEGTCYLCNGLLGTHGEIFHPFGTSLVCPGDWVLDPTHGRGPPSVCEAFLFGDFYEEVAI